MSPSGSPISGEPGKNPSGFQRLASIIADYSNRFLDWLLEVVAKLLVISVALLFAYGCILLIILPDSPADSRIGQMLALLNANWPVLLLLGLPLFFQTVRDFLAGREPSVPGMRKKTGGEVAPTSRATATTGQMSMPLNPIDKDRPA